MSSPMRDFLGDVLDLLPREFRIHRKRENARGRLLSDWQWMDPCRPPPREALLLVNGDGIVREGGDSPRREIGLQLISIVALNSVEVIDVCVTGRRVRQSNACAG